MEIQEERRVRSNQQVDDITLGILVEETQREHLSLTVLVVVVVVVLLRGNNIVSGNVLESSTWGR